MRHSNRSIRLLMGICCALAWATPFGAAHADCVVTNTLDAASSSPPAPDSLRDCLERARAGDTITFDANIFDLVNSDAATTIDVQSELPALDDGSVTIDAKDRRVTINGSGAGSVRGLVVSSSGNRIGGLTIVGFAGGGVQVSAADNRIGGSRATGTGPNGQGLRIANCGAFGVEISGAGTTANVVKGCWIGLDKSGEIAQPNLTGIVLRDGAASNTIGGTVPGEANVISGNSFEGVTVSGTGTDDNVLIGNVIGEGGTLDASGGRSAIGNGSAGIFLSKGTKNRIGGDGAGEGNVVANNGGNGVEVRSSESRCNSARGNRITRNSSGGIALFDGSNDAIKPPTIQKVQDLGVNGAGTGRTLHLTGSTSHPGGVEVFSDTGSQGATLHARTASTGTWSVDIDVSAIANLTATVTDALDNTSQFGVFGLTDGDTDGDGFSDEIETLAGTNPSDQGNAPALVGTLGVQKLQIKLSFAKSGQDAVAVTTNVSLPPGFVANGATLGVSVAGHTERFTLDEKGKGASTNGSIAVKTSKKTGPYVKYGFKKGALQALAASFGLANGTTAKTGEGWLVPVAVTVGNTVYATTVTLTYKATQGKSGKAKISR